MIHTAKNYYVPSFFIFLGLLLISSACRLDDTSANPNVVHGFNSFETIFSDTARHTQIKTLDATEDMVFTSEDGANIKLDANSLTFPDGSLVTGAVELQLIEATKKSDWVMGNRPLLNSSGQLLEAVSGFSLEAWKDQKLLKLNGTTTLLFEESGQIDNPDDELEVYYDSNDNDVWEKATDESDISVTEIAGGDVYEMTATQLGWMISGRPFVPNNGTTTITVTTNRDNLDFIDQKVYILFDEFNGMASLPKNGTTFSASGMPLTQSGTLVVVAFDKYNFYFGSQEITIAENMELQVNIRTYSLSDFLLSVRSID